MKRARVEIIDGHFRSVGANVRAHRVRAGMTQEQLAEASEVDLRFLQRIERASANFSVRVLFLLADALGVHPGELLRAATLVPTRPGRPKGRARVAEEPELASGPQSTLRPTKPIAETGGESSG